MSKFTRLCILAVGLASGLAACLPAKETPPTTAASPGIAGDAGAGSQLALRPGLADAVAIGSVDGGDATDPLWTPASFKPALQESLASQGYLAPQPEAAAYAVEATLERVERPSTGEFVEVRTFVAYSVVRLADGTVILNRTIAASYTAATLEEAADGSIRANVTQFVGVLSETYAALPEAQTADGMTLASARTSNADPRTTTDTQQAALQREFDAWLFANRETFNAQLGDTVAGPAGSLQQVSNVRVLERTAGGYLAEVAYSVGNSTTLRSETGRFFLATGRDGRLAGVDALEAI